MKLEGAYIPKVVEQYGQERHQSGDSYRAGVGAKTSAPTYSIVLPPPNVTGSLHMGHALNHSLQDILVRYHRMLGFNTLWQPGTDHAGIATQSVVEKQLASNNTTRQDLGREKFVERVWQWKAESGDTIVKQQKILGESCDWTRQRFTMDEGLSQAVRKVFVQLHKEGLIYRDKRLVNWDPALHTAISDLEVIQKDVKGSMWRIRDPLKDDPTRHIVVATTRPETLLGDAAVAVHPDDERYQELIGKEVLLPLTGKSIPIVADEHSDPEKGTGAVKITPAHDFNDFEVGKRHQLARINVLTIDAKIADSAPGNYAGMDRFAARKQILLDLEDQGLLDGEDENDMTIPYGDRSGVIIEPFLTDQWFVDAEVLAQPAIKAVEEERVKFVPKHWEKTYFEWMHNIQPWCISRQIWWGHQIPAWYGPDGTVFVEEDEATALEAAFQHYGEEKPLTRDTDVLDTWFSSALWPFSTLGWPEKTPELASYYPTSVLVTGFDIIFFWVARMMMMGIKFMDEVPFKTVYIHALVRDEHGDKMSKSKGNIVDPLDIIDEYGADALRFTLTSMAAMGRDIKLNKDRIEGYRHFGNKIWNAIRFCQMQDGFEDVAGLEPSPATPADDWITLQLQTLHQTVSAGLENYRFNEIAQSLYGFIWGDFCDWYLEATKISLKEHPEQTPAILNHLKWAVRQWLLALHPVMPYITEYIWNEALGWQELPSTHWQPISAGVFNAEHAQSFAEAIKIIQTVRSARSENNFAPSASIDLYIEYHNDKLREAVQQGLPWLKALTKSTTIQEGVNEAPGIREHVSDLTLTIPFGNAIDFSDEIRRLEKEIAKLEAELKKIDSKLNNSAFLEKAPATVVQKNQNEAIQFAARKVDLSEQLVKLKTVQGGV